MKRIIAIFNRTASHWDDDGYRFGFEARCDFCNCVFEVCTNHIHLVDKNQSRDFVFIGLSPNCFGLCFHAFLSIKDYNATVKDSKAAFDFGGEIDMPWGIDQIDSCFAPLEGNASAVNGDTAFLFFFIVICGGIA